eukprot:6388221-Prymnesium_polylepis.1
MAARASKQVRMAAYTPSTANVAFTVCTQPSHLSREAGHDKTRHEKHSGLGVRRRPLATALHGRRPPRRR